MLQLDQVTQQNAAMFEETTAASQALAREADGLSEIMGRFRVETAASSARPQPAASAAAAPAGATAGFRSIRNHAAPAPVAVKDRAVSPIPPSPAARSAAPPARAAAGGLARSGHRLSALAVKPSAAEDDWQDF